jgi:hypothetical protein
MSGKISFNAQRLLNEYTKIISMANNESIPCYVAASIIGFTPAIYLSILNEIGLIDGCLDVLELLRTTDLKNFLTTLEDDNRSIGGALFKPLFELPEIIPTEIPTVSVTFDIKELDLKQI